MKRKDSDSAEASEVVKETCKEVLQDNTAYERHTSKKKCYTQLQWDNEGEYLS